MVDLGPLGIEHIAPPRVLRPDSAPLWLARCRHAPVGAPDPNEAPRGLLRTRTRFGFPFRVVQTRLPRLRPAAEAAGPPLAPSRSSFCFHRVMC